MLTLLPTTHRRKKTRFPVEVRIATEGVAWVQIILRIGFRVASPGNLQAVPGTIADVKCAKRCDVPSGKMAVVLGRPAIEMYPPDPLHMADGGSIICIRVSGKQPFLSLDPCCTPTGPEFRLLIKNNNV
ncbi:MAG: hypothetical protein WCB46_04935, partial [Methanoregula sp.]